MLGAAGHEQVPFAAADGAGRVHDSGQAGAAQSVHSQSPRLEGEACHQSGVAGDIAGILTRLVGAARNDIFVVGWSEAISFDYVLDDTAQQVVRAYGC